MKQSQLTFECPGQSYLKSGRFGAHFAWKNNLFLTACVILSHEHLGVQLALTNLGKQMDLAQISVKEKWLYEFESICSIS